MYDAIAVVYTAAQFVNFVAIWPVINKVRRSKTAEAISVPALSWYTVNGVITTTYMASCGCHWFICVVMFLQLVVANSVLVTIAARKQRKAKK